MPREIISLSLGPSRNSGESVIDVFGEPFNVRRLGTDGDLSRVRMHVAGFDGKVDVICLEDMQLFFRIGRRMFRHRQIQHVVESAHSTPVVDGTHLGHTLDRWAISLAMRQDPDLFHYKEILFLSGIHQLPLAQVLRNATDRLIFCDPIFNWNVPFTLHSLPQLERYARSTLPYLCKTPYLRLVPKRPRANRLAQYLAKLFSSADVIVGDVSTIRLIAPSDLRRKIIVTSRVSEDELDDLRDNGVESVVNLSPTYDRAQPFIDKSVIEGALACRIGIDVAAATDDQYLDLVSEWDCEPQVFLLNKPPDTAKFAFVIHPLTVNHIYNHPILRYLRFVPKRIVERSVANLPPLYLSRMTGIRSAATGKAVEGYLITLGATPREFLRRKPSFTYRRLIVASRIAQRKGARIMGLGAFTKVVGDAGITVGQKADIAITSGNSLTVAATLEAAKLAVLKMGAQDLTRGRALVIGATGSIGAVSSRLLAQAILDVVLVAPRPERLIELKQKIEAETPGARVVIATDAAPYLPTADLVVTTTTAIGEKVIDVLKLKPGCVVCDVARPPDVKEEDALLRPDVLVIESGEVLLPGEPDFGFNIGLPPGVAYACLAETALLAMEGRFENFTLGRNIEMERVKEIYRLFKKHGLQLEGLRSFGKYVSDEEIAVKRRLADELRSDPRKLELLQHNAIAADARRGPSPDRDRGTDIARSALGVIAAVGSAAVAVEFLRRYRRH
jgi:predicted amino acid dehydrogenase